MDPLSQAVLGGLAAQASAKPQQLKHATVIGAIAGMAADADVLIRSSTDPLLSLEFHRHFTHSLAFIPIGGLLCAMLLHPLFGRRWHYAFSQTLWWCCLGYGTHALLDACTSYGTRLLWPFNNTRIAWDTLSVIDPLLTLPLLTLLLFGALRYRKHFTYTAIAWLGLYLSLGVIQHQRATTLGEQLANSRGHHPTALSAKPSFGNIIVWKVIYETNNRYYVDAIKPGLNNATTWRGDSIAKLNPQRHLPWLQANSQHAKDIARFSHFSDGYIAPNPHQPNRLIDVRYSMLPHQIDALWGIQLNPSARHNEHVQWVNTRGDSNTALRELWRMLWHSE